MTGSDKDNTLLAREAAGISQADGTYASVRDQGHHQIHSITIFIGPFQISEK